MQAAKKGLIRPNEVSKQFLVSVPYTVIVSDIKEFSLKKDGKTFKSRRFLWPLLTAPLGKF